MSESTILKYIIIASLATGSVLVFLVPDYSITLPGTIRKNATRDLTYVGAYDNKMQVSLNIWLFHVIVLCKTVYGWVDIKGLLRGWEETIYDSNGLIKNCVSESLAKFDKIVRDAQASDTEPVFKRAQGYDYHVLPSTLRCNDYVNLGYLIERIDTEIGGI